MVVVVVGYLHFSLNVTHHFYHPFVAFGFPLSLTSFTSFAVKSFTIENKKQTITTPIITRRIIIMRKIRFKKLLIENIRNI